MVTIKTGRVLSAQVKVDNSADENREYAMECQVNVSAGMTGSGISQGVVKKGDVQVASFSKYQYVGVNYMVEDVDMQKAILDAIHSFCEDVEVFSKNVTLKAEVE